jgi:hypothetical protein
MEKCPEGKEINPKTGRCIQKCKEGEIRNPDTGRCIKIKPKSKDCPSGKELNPKTGRCIQKCKEGEIRNPDTGRCIKIKPKSKDCPSGKELNPKTGRCINKCKEGEVRNPETGKCIKIKKVSPKISPKLSPKISPKLSPKLSPKVSPKISPKISPKLSPKLSPKVSPKLSPKLSPKVSPKISPKISPKLSPKLSPKVSPKISPKLSPKVSPKVSPKISPDSSKSSSKVSQLNGLYYPDINDSKFAEKIASNNQFNIHKISNFPTINNIEEFNKMSNKLCGKLELSMFQYFISQYLSNRTPYRSILLYHGVGVGKTCSSITVAELILSAKTMDISEPTVWVIMPKSLKQNFKRELFKIESKSFKDLNNQCTGDNYIKLLNIDEKTYNDNFNISENFKENLNKNLKDTLNKRYRLFTYDDFSKYISEKYKDKVVENKVIIIDEAHNIRSTNNKDKDSYLKIKETLKNGINNRLVLLSATPMYNESRDILDLFNLMLINDKRHDILSKYKNVFNNTIKLKLDDDVIGLIKKLSSNYISYLKGKNPFTFALKLKPSMSGIKILEKVPTKDPSNKNIPKAELSWLKNIKDDIITSKLGIAQKNKIEELGFKNIRNITVDAENSDTEEFIEDTNGNENKNNNMGLSQAMNIVYDDSMGEKGFYTFFTKTTQQDPINVKYNTQYQNALYPDEEHLGKYSGKFLNMCNFIRKSKGIVIIYSKYLWAGIIPFAVCLEHLGYTRYGANNILQNPEIVKDLPVYDGVKRPKYCILTSDKKEIMGSTSIDNLIKVINNDNNIKGANIKVILITPVASEGLSFYNAREIHLIEPWYHFNRPEQIIGRGIRNCRHQKLPFEERNVTVFMHASTDDDTMRETLDIHALRISTRKLIESKNIDNIISNNALDCALMKNINYFPKSIFKLGVVDIETSRGERIKYEIGDDSNIEPTCSQNIKVDKSGYRSEIYKHLLKKGRSEIKNQLEKYIEDKIFYVTLEKLIKDVDLEEDIILYTIYKSIKPLVLVNNYYITPYKNGIKLNKIDDTNYSSRIKIIINEDKIIESNVSKSRNNIDDIMKLISVDFGNIIKTTISLYLLDNNLLLILINYILHNCNDIKDRSILYVADCLYKQGLLIKKTEIPSYKYNDNNYIGYYNIYNTENRNVQDDIVTLYNKVKKIEKVGITETELKELKKNRYKMPPIPKNMELEKMPYGIILPEENKKTKKFKNILKIFSTDTDKGRGRTCSVWNISELDKFINQIDNSKIKMKNKDKLCSHIAEQLMDKNRLILLPVYKPVIKPLKI